MKHTFADISKRLALPALTVLAASIAMPAQAQKGPNYPITGKQRATAQQVAQAGVPLSALAPNAPDEYTVRRGDTLWRISGLFLRTPWRWPELWGMNMNDIRNPHLIFPGQKLYLDKSGGRARLRLMKPLDGTNRTVRVSPHTRAEALDSNPLPTLQPHLIEPFLAEPIVADLQTFETAPRIVARTEERVLMARGDRAYARGPKGSPLKLEEGQPTLYRVFRRAVPLKDPETGEILGYEGQFVGKVNLVRSETMLNPKPGKKGEEPEYDPPRVPAAGMRNPGEYTDAELRQLGYVDANGNPVGKDKGIPVPATVDVVSTKEEMKVDDRLLPEPEQEFRNYTPHAPLFPIDARVVSVYGSAVRSVGQNQIVAINKGAQDGVESGQVMALYTTGKRIKDKTASERGEFIRLPDERNGLGMVFRVFDRVSYVLIMEINLPVEVGDKLVNPTDPNGTDALVP